jgi:hypothetical protein
MISYTTKRFRKLFASLPKDIKEQAKEAYTKFKKDPYYLPFTKGGLVRKYGTFRSGTNYLLGKPIRPFTSQLAVRAIVMKYIRFAKRLMCDPAFAANVSSF